MYDDQFCASEDSVVINCDPCQFDGIQEEARAFCQDCNEFLCQQCLKSHKKFQAFRQHYILQGDSMPRTREETKPKLALKLCDNHQMNEVQFYCMNHKCVFCSLCKMAKHSSCDYKSIDELISASEDQGKFDNVVRKMEAIKTEFEQLKAVRIEDIDSTAVYYKIQRDNLDSVRIEMNLVFDRLAHEIEEHEVKGKTYAKKLKGEVQIFTEAINHLVSLKESIHNVSQSNDRAAIFSARCKLEKIAEDYSALKENIPSVQKGKQSQDVAKKLLKVKEIVKTIEEKVNTKSSQSPYENDKKHSDHHENMLSKDEIPGITNKETNYNTREDNNICLKAVDDATMIGETSIEKNAEIKREKLDHYKNERTATNLPEAQTHKMSFDNMRQKSVSHHSINVEGSDYTCDITGSLFLPDGSLILCDHGNSKVILLDRNFKILDQLEFVGNLWDVALFNKNEIIVTLRYSKLLKFIHIESGKLTEGRRINLKMVPWGIAVYQSYILVTFHNNPGNGVIEIRDTNGRVMQTIAKNESGEELFSTPFYVTVNKQNGDIYVTDSRKNSLICLSFNGEVLYTVKSDKLNWPRKVIVDDFGNCLLCASLAKKVLLIHKKAKSSITSNIEAVDLKVLSKECYRPQTVSMRWEDHTLVLGLHMTNKLQVINLMLDN